MNGGYTILDLSKKEPIAVEQNDEGVMIGTVEDYLTDEELRKLKLNKPLYIHKLRYSILGYNNYLSGYATYDDNTHAYYLNVKGTIKDTGEYESGCTVFALIDKIDGFIKIGFSEV